MHRNISPFQAARVIPVLASLPLHFWCALDLGNQLPIPVCSLPHVGSESLPEERAGLGKAAQQVTAVETQ